MPDKAGADFLYWIMKAGMSAFMISAFHRVFIMAKKTAPKVLPVVPRPVNVTTSASQDVRFKPLQIRIEPQRHREIKIAAAEQGKSMTAFLLECYDFWCSMHK